LVCGAHISAFLRCKPHSCFHREYYTGGEGKSVAAQRMNRFLAPTHQWQKQGWLSHKYHFSSLQYNQQGIESSQPALVVHALPTVPFSWFRLDIVMQNKILVQFHNYLVLEKVQWRL